MRASRSSAFSVLVTLGFTPSWRLAFASQLRRQDSLIPEVFRDLSDRWFTAPRNLDDVVAEPLGWGAGIVGILPAATHVATGHDDNRTFSSPVVQRSKEPTTPRMTGVRVPSRWRSRRPVAARTGRRVLEKGGRPR